MEEEQLSGGSRYNIEEEESKKEYFDSAEALEKKVTKVADWVKASKQASKQAYYRVHWRRS